MTSKYIMCNFGYYDEENNRSVSLIYTGIFKGQGNDCQRCGKKINGKAHYFTEESPENEEWTFGSDCVKYVFGAGLQQVT